jgi:AcrR family transcriptional regulator
VKASQQERILAGMLIAANRDGYAGANVSAVIAQAGVSRPTFYEYFADKEDCFLALHRATSERLIAQIELALAEAPGEQAPLAAIVGLIENAAAEPAQAKLLTGEAMAGGPSALEERDRTIARIVDLVEAARAELAPDTPSPDLPSWALIGAIHWLLVPRLRRGERDFTGLIEELSGWIAGYNRPAGEHRWRKLEPGPAPGSSPHRAALSPVPPPPIPSGRSRLSKSEVAENQRMRILFATAEVACEKGYSATTISDIIKAAAVDKRVFYKHFRDKQEPFLAVHELGFQQLMAVAASAYFSAEGWPERIWEGLLAGNQFLATYPTLSHIGLVEPHAVGAPAKQRTEESQVAFTLFLQEGNQRAPNPQTRTAFEAIAAAIFEIGYIQFRRDNAGQLPRFVPHAVYLCLAPFLGPEAAIEFVDGKMERNGVRNR